MDTVPPPEPTRTGRCRLLRSPYVIAVGGSAAAVVWLVGVAYLAGVWDQWRRPPQCFGIGWGCTPDAAFNAILLAVLSSWVPIAAALAVGLVEALRITRWRDRRPTLQRWIAWSIAIGVGGAVALFTVPAVVATVVDAGRAALGR